MKFIQPYKIFESKESDLMHDDIMDIFIDTIEETNLDVYTYCTDSIVAISIKRSVTRKPGNSGWRSPESFKSSLVSQDIERVINYLDDKVLSVAYTYAPRKWESTISIDSIPIMNTEEGLFKDEADIYELNVEIRLKKLKRSKRNLVIGLEQMSQKKEKSICIKLLIYSLIYLMTIILLN